MNLFFLRSTDSGSLHLLPNGYFVPSLRAARMLVTAAAVSYAVAVGLKLFLKISFPPSTTGGVYGWIAKNHYPKEQELFYFLLAVVGIPLAVVAAHLVWVGISLAISHLRRIDLHTALQLSAWSALPLLFVWWNMYDLARPPLRDIGGPALLAVVLLVGLVWRVGKPILSLRDLPFFSPPGVERMTSSPVTAFGMAVFVYLLTLTGDVHHPVDLFHYGELLVPLSEMRFGRLPYRDLHIQHGFAADVGIPWLGYQLIDPSLFGVRAAVRLIEPLGFVALFLLARQVLRSAVLLPGLLVFLQAGQNSWVGPRLILFLLSLACAARAAHLSRRKWAGVSGLLAGIALWHSVESGLFAMSTGFLFFTAMAVFGRVPWSWCGTFLLGAASALIPGLLVLSMTGAWEGFIRTLSLQIDSQLWTWGLPFVSIHELLEPLRSGGYIGGMRDFLLGIPLRYYLSIGALIIAGVTLTHQALAGDLLRTKSNQLLFLIWLAGVIQFRSALGRSDLGHQVDSTAFSSLLLFLLFERATRWAWYQSYPLRFLAVTLLAIPAGVLLWRVHRLHHPEYRLRTFSPVTARFPARHTDWDGTLPQLGPIRLDPAEQRKFTAAVDYIHRNTADGDPILDLSNQGGWYYLANRPSATRYFQIAYASPPEQQREVVRELERHRPHLIIASSGLLFDCIDFVFLEERHPIIWEYIQEHYEFADEIEKVVFMKRRE